MSDEAPAVEAAAPAPEKAKPAAKKGKAPAKGKDAKGAGKSKDKGKGKSKAGAAGTGMSVASHPRAAASVRQAKGWGGIAAFGITAYVSLSHGVSPDVAGLRAIGAGIVGYVLAWGCGVMVWRHLMVAELRARVERARELHEPPPTPAEEPSTAPS
jgi:hypothetical protein